MGKDPNDIAGALHACFTIFTSLHPISLGVPFFSNYDVKLFLWPYFSHTATEASFPRHFGRISLSTALGRGSILRVATRPLASSVDGSSSEISFNLSEALEAWNKKPNKPAISWEKKHQKHPRFFQAFGLPSGKKHVQVFRGIPNHLFFQGLC